MAATPGAVADGLEGALLTSDAPAAPAWTADELLAAMTAGADPAAEPASPQGVPDFDVSLLAVADRQDGRWRDIARRLESTPTKAAVILGGGAVLTALMFGALALLGSLLA